MHVLQKYLLFLLFFSLLFACRKKRCSDGVMNHGETGIDCGGKCAPCPELTNREIAVQDYNDNYLGSAISDNNLSWTGNVSSCNPGGVSASTDQKVLQRINYFRRLVGLNDNITLDESNAHKYQKAALMLKANNDLDHFPPNSWTCWTQDGYDGCNTSNIALGVHSVDAITLFIEDPGAFNNKVGHRRWIFHSEKLKFSYGTTDNSMSQGCIGAEFDGNTSFPDFIAYPPANYIPQQLVFDRWSFGLPGSFSSGADFSSASVVMNGPNGLVPLTIVSANTTNMGDNTIVWEPQGINTNSQEDVEYTVTISNIANASQSSYTYTVKIINP